MDFEWDAGKAQINLEKHGVRFEIAAGVFCDPERVTVVDDRIDYGEKRLVTFGLIDNRLYVVVSVEGEGARVMRIISARKANSRERKHHGTG